MRSDAGRDGCSKASNDGLTYLQKENSESTISDAPFSAVRY